MHLHNFPLKPGDFREVKTHLFSYLLIIKRAACLYTLRPLHGNGYPGEGKLVASAVFLKLVRPLVFSDPACAENRVVDKAFSTSVHSFQRKLGHKRRGGAPILEKLQNLTKISAPR